MQGSGIWNVQFKASPERPPLSGEGSAWSLDHNRAKPRGQPTLAARCVSGENQTSSTFVPELNEPVKRHGRAVAGRARCGQSNEAKRRESGRFCSEEGPAGVRARRTLDSRFQVWQAATRSVRFGRGTKGTAGRIGPPGGRGRVQWGRWRWRGSATALAPRELGCETKREDCKYVRAAGGARPAPFHRTVGENGRVCGELGQQIWLA